jgi:hypothetical protein
LGQFVPPAEGKLTLAPRLAPYLAYTGLFVLVPTFFVGAASFAIGTLTGSMKSVYIAVTALLVGWFLVVGALSDDQLRWLAYIEPSGQAWLSEQVARGRGSAWLNEHAIRPDLGLWINRVVLVGLGIGSLAWTCAVWRPRRLKGSTAASCGEPAQALVLVGAREDAGRRRPLHELERARRGAARRACAGERCDLARAAVGLLVTELRLVAAERSLWIMVPIVMLLAGVDSVSHVGPFQVRVYPVSSEFAQQMVPTLLILLAGTTIFYTGEIFHRDDSSGLRGILYATPASNSTLLLAKLGAMLLLSSGMVLLTVLTALVSQAVQWYGIDGRMYLDLAPYGPVLLRVVLPSILFLSMAALGRQRADAPSLRRLLRVHPAGRHLRLAPDRGSPLAALQPARDRALGLLGSGRARTVRAAARLAPPLLGRGARRAVRAVVLVDAAHARKLASIRLACGAARASVGTVGGALLRRPRDRSWARDPDARHAARHARGARARVPVARGSLAEPGRRSAALLPARRPAGRSVARAAPCRRARRARARQRRRRARHARGVHRRSALRGAAARARGRERGPPSATDRCGSSRSRVRSRPAARRG